VKRFPKTGPRAWLGRCRSVVIDGADEGHDRLSFCRRHEIDAVATAFALAGVEPWNSGQGSIGFALAHMAGKQRIRAKYPYLIISYLSICRHSTVTDLARLRGWSTSVPFNTAT
jgi:hypothetical protein